MALVKDDFKQPKGLLSQALFVEGSIDDYLDAYLLAAATEVADISTTKMQDKATKAYVYYRAFEQIVIWANAEPAEMTEDGGNTSRKFNDQQIERFESMRDKYLAEFQEIDTDVVPDLDPQSYSIRVNGGW